MTILEQKVLTSKDIRLQFIEYFKARAHSFVHSSPVIPQDDPTLLFANAGMNQFKNIFLGLVEPEHPRAVNSQKCIRAGGKHNDLEEVGKDGYHHTFFEMLGNWSFGDYYKKDAILWAWELLTDVWKLPKELLHVTVHDSDNEAAQIWQQETDVTPTQITFHGDKDNFWEMGETGPCGPCSEIHIDRGEAHCNKKGEPGHVCRVNGDCDRYIELWNLVFIQYKREEDRSLSPLKNRYVDTGAGLERVCQVLQDKSTNYETDLFMPIIGRIAELSQKPYSEADGMSHRVIADHIRCLVFALADGGFPSNEGRGYVLRRILRRAARHGRLLGFAEPFLFHLVDVVIEIMGHHFDELNGRGDYIKMVIKAEEERFNKTLDTGLIKFEEILAHTAGKVICGKDVFMLYDTYGFPPDLTATLAEEHGLCLDEAGFAQEMALQKERARKASKFESSIQEMEWIDFSASSPTVFSGYSQHSDKSKIQRYSLLSDGTYALQLQQTPFYAESGGQVADTGRIYNDEFELNIHDVKKLDDYYIHYGRLMRGLISNTEVNLEIDSKRRRRIQANHSATHLLHKALKSVLGDHVQQKGSLVHPDYLRFDFTHFQASTAEEQRQVETLVNEAIRENYSVDVSIKSISKAKAEGAVALFGEKYADQVRVIAMEGYSKELCGGTHVAASGEIGLFVIYSESSIAAGIRRIEAYTGAAALEYIEGWRNSLEKVATQLGSPINMIHQKLDMQKAHIYELEKEIKMLQAERSNQLINSVLGGADEYPGFKLIIHRLPDNTDLKAITDVLRDKLNHEIAVLYSVKDDKLSILTVVGEGLKKSHHAGKIISAIAAKLGGKGGGRADSAMAGSPLPQNWDILKSEISGIILSFNQ